METQVKRLLFSAIAIGLATFAAPAHAAIIGPGFGVNPTSAQGAFSNAPGTGVFFDQYLFQLVGAGFITVVSADNTFASGGIDGPNGIANFTGAIYEIVGAVDAAPGGDDNLVFGPQAATLCDSGLCQQLDGFGLMQPGNYYLAIAGNAGATAGYGGNLSVSEVPLPGAVWLFGSVLAGIGGAVKLRKLRRKA